MLRNLKIFSKKVKNRGIFGTKKILLQKCVNFQIQSLAAKNRHLKFLLNRRYCASDFLCHVNFARKIFEKKILKICGFLGRIFSKFLDFLEIFRKNPQNSPKNKKILKNSILTCGIKQNGWRPHPHTRG